MITGNNDLLASTVLFEEKYAMAQSQKNAWTKSVSTWKCVLIRLTVTHLHVSLHGLLGLMVKPFGADIDHIIPLDYLTAVRKNRVVIGYGEVEVVFRLQDGGTRTLLLYLKRADEFVNLAGNYVR